MSRQRLRPSLDELTTEICPRCSGQGRIRDIESLALSILRVLEEESLKERSSIVRARVPLNVAAYLLNEKRREVADIEQRTTTHVVIVPAMELETPHYEIQRIRDDTAETESTVPSYELTETGLTTEPLEVREKPAPKPAQEAAVKAPPLPQPPTERRAEATPAKTSGFAKFLRAVFTDLFSGKAAADTDAGRPAKKDAQSMRSNRPRNRGGRSQQQAGADRHKPTGERRPRRGEARGEGADADKRRRRPQRTEGGNRSEEARQGRQRNGTPREGGQAESRSEQARGEPSRRRRSRGPRRQPRAEQARAENAEEPSQTASEAGDQPPRDAGNDASRSRRKPRRDRSSLANREQAAPPQRSAPPPDNKPARAAPVVEQAAAPTEEPAQPETPSRPVAETQRASNDPRQRRRRAAEAKDEASAEATLVEPDEPAPPLVEDVAMPPETVEHEAATETAGPQADVDVAQGDPAPLDAPAAALDDKLETVADADAPDPAPLDVPATEEVAPAPAPPPHHGRALNDPRELRKGAARDTSTSDAALD